MKDNMFETDIDDYDSDIDTPDPDMLYRIINSPLPKMPKLVLPKWFGIPDFNLQWRRLKCRKWLLAAITVGFLAIIGGLLFHYSYLLK